MGKLALRPLLERGADIAFLNDIEGDPAMHAYLLEFDSVHGRWPAEFKASAHSIAIDDVKIPVCKEARLQNLPLDGIDVVIDCTGAFKTKEKLQSYFDAGVKKVVVSAPVKDGGAAPGLVVHKATRGSASQCASNGLPQNLVNVT